MRTANVIVIKEDDLRKELAEFAMPIVEASVKDVVCFGSEGNPYLAEVIRAGGFEKMPMADLIEQSEPWAEMTLDSHEGEEDAPEGILVIGKNHQQTMLYLVEEKEEVPAEKV